MSTFFYAPKVTEGLPELMERLEARRVSKHDGMNLIYKGRPLELSEGDVVVCWGAFIPNIPNVKVLNGSSKFRKDEGVTRYLSRNAKYTSKLRMYKYSDPIQYELGLAQFEQQLKDPHSVVTHRHVPNYYTMNYGIKFKTKLHIFGNEILQELRSSPNGNYSKPKKPLLSIHELYAKELKETLDLTFGVFTVFSYGSNSQSKVTYRFSSAPNLDSDQVLMYAEKIRVWIDSPIVEAAPIFEDEIIDMSKPVIGSAVVDLGLGNDPAQAE